MTVQPRIMFIIDSLGPGGAERSLVELLSPLVELGVEPVVVTLRAAGVGFEEDVRASGVRIIHINAVGFLGRVRALRELIRIESPDLVHTTLFNSDVAGRLACARMNTRLSTSLVNTSYDPARYTDPSITRWKLESVRWIDGWTARHMCDHFHAITQSVKASSVEALGIDPDRVEVIPRGRDWERLGEPSLKRRAQVRSRLGLRPDQMVLLNIGRQEYQKGQRYLIEAVDGLVRDQPSIVLMIAGREGNVSQELRAAIADRGLSERVLLLGHRRDVGDLLAASDVFVFPSIYEGLGGSLLEAMMMEVPVVASDIATFREVLGDDYPLLCSTDPTSIAEEVRCLIASETLRKEVVKANSVRIQELLAGEPTRSLAYQLVSWASRASQREQK